MRYRLALSDTEIRDWDQKINQYNINSGYRFGVIARFISESGFPAIAINTYEDNQFNDWSRRPNNKQSKIDFTVDYTYTFSISEEKEEIYKESLNKLRSYKIENYFIIDDNIIDVNFNDKPTESREEHIVNNKKYIRYSYSLRSLICNVIVQFWLIETSLKFSIRDRKFKINDIVSPTNDRSIDFLIIEETLDGDFIAVKIKEMKENYIEYDLPTTLRNKDLTWSRTNRIDNIINDAD